MSNTTIDHLAIRSNDVGDQVAELRGVWRGGSHSLGPTTYFGVEVDGGNVPCRVDDVRLSSKLHGLVPNSVVTVHGVIDVDERGRAGLIVYNIREERHLRAPQPSIAFPAFDRDRDRNDPDLQVPF